MEFISSFMEPMCIVLKNEISFLNQLNVSIIEY